LAPKALFVRGCARSGTTLLADVLDEHPKIGLLVEQPLGDVVRRIDPVFWYEEHWLAEREAIARAGAKSAARTAKTEHFKPRDNAGRLTFPRRYPSRERLAHILAGIVEASLEKRDLLYIGSKTPGHWRYDDVRRVAGLYGEPKYVFLLRNPFDNVNSIVNRRNAARAGRDAWPDKPIEEAIARYQEAICLVLSCRDRFAEQTFVVGYEDLVAHPSRTLSALGEFLELELDDWSHLITSESPQRKVFTEREERAVREQLGAAIDSWSSKHLTIPIARLGTQVDDCVRTVTRRTEYRFDAPVGDRGLLGTGWGDAEPAGIVSDAPSADLYFRVPDDGEYTVVIELAAQIDHRSGPLDLTAQLGERRLEQTLHHRRNVRLHVGPVPLQAGIAYRIALAFGDSSKRVRIRRFSLR